MQTFIDEVKNELKICESETEKIANVGSVEENAKSEADMVSNYSLSIYPKGNL